MPYQYFIWCNHNQDRISGWLVNTMQKARLSCNFVPMTKRCMTSNRCWQVEYFIHLREMFVDNTNKTSTCNTIFVRKKGHRNTQNNGKKRCLKYCFPDSHQWSLADARWFNVSHLVCSWRTLVWAHANSREKRHHRLLVHYYLSR